MSEQSRKNELEEINKIVTGAILSAYDIGYDTAIDEAASRLEMIAACVPSSVTKVQLIKLCADEARAIRARSMK